MEVHVKPASVDAAEARLVDRFIGEELAPLVRDRCQEWVICFLELRTVNTIMVMSQAPEHELGDLPTHFRSFPIQAGTGRAAIYTEADFSEAVVDSRLIATATGASIGLAECTQAGTLGLYVRPRVSSEAIAMLTAYHVVSDRLGRSDQVVSPARGDLSNIISRKESELRSLQEDLEVLTALGDTKRLTRTQIKVEDAQDMLQAAQADLKIGKVFRHVLRMATDNEEYLDAALITVNVDRLNGWAPTCLNDPFPRLDFPVSVRESGTSFDGLKDVATIGRAEPLEKVGRTSGYTTGFLNSVKVRLLMSTPFGMVNELQAWGVVSKDRNGAFTQPGDSGSMIFTGRKLVGMVFGGVNGEINGYSIDVTLFTPMARLQEVLEFDLL